jgi:opacity protein-like surface antigen
MCSAFAFPTAASGQQRPAVTRTAPRQQTLFRGFGDLGATRFAAADSFKAVLGSSFGVVFGGGGEIVLPQRVFVRGRISRFEKSGERVFVLDDELFPLGIDTTVRMTPVEFSAGYRFQPRSRTGNVIPYLAAGVGWHRYEETSEFSAADENVAETFIGYHVLGGAEFRMGRLFAIGGEAQWTTVPDAFGAEPGSVSAAFDETDLGGISFRVRFIIGR